jgi:hypothetical protein
MFAKVLFVTRLVAVSPKTTVLPASPGRPLQICKLPVANPCVGAAPVE